MKLTWHEGNKCWTVPIGKVKNKNGRKLVRKYFYLSPNKGEAELTASKLQATWKALKINWKNGRQIMLAMRDDKFFNKPHWLKMDYVDILVASRGGEIEKPVDPNEADFKVVDIPETMTLEKCRFYYLAHERNRIGIADGIKPGTFRNTELFLKYAFKAIEKNPKCPNIHTDLKLELLNRTGLEELKSYLMGLPGSMSKRTAVNYLKAFKGMLDFVYDSDLSGDLRKPKGYDQVFKFKQYKTPHIQIFDNNILRLLYANAVDRTRLYMLLALNLGMTQIDLATLKRDEINLSEGYIYWAREKTSHQNTFKTKHSLWPETLRLLKQEIAKDGELALVNEDKKPLLTQTAKGSRIDNISSAFKRVVVKINKDREEKELPPISARFKDFRKTGATMVRRLGDEQLSRQYLSHSIENMSKFYNQNSLGDFDLMNQVLKKWGTELGMEIGFQELPNNMVLVQE